MAGKSNGIVTNAKTPYSVEDGVSYRSDPLKVDPLTNGISMWEAIDGGDAIGIDNDKLDINLSASISALTGSTDINSRTQGIYATYIPRLMADLNLTDFQAAAIFGNAAYESASFNDLVEGPFSNYTDPNYGVGWLQWTGPRHINYMNYCDSRGLDWQSDEANYSYIVYELRGNDGNWWYPGTDWLFDSLPSFYGFQTTTFVGTITTDINNAAWYFLEGYVRSENPYASISLRAEYALDALAVYRGGNIPVPVPGATIYGDAGKNNLIGGAGDDTLYGLGGNDRLSGSAGSDTLTGGTGKDTLVFNTTLNGATNIDLITDFSTKDRIELSRTVFTDLPFGTLAAGAFVIASSATDTGDRIIYNSTSGALSYDPDGTGITPAIQFATLSSGLPLSNTDFVVT